MAFVESMAKSAFRQMLRSLFKVAKNVVLVFLGLIPAVIWGDHPGHVRKNEAAWSETSQFASAALWCSFFPYMIWNLRDAQPAAPYALIAVLPLAYFWAGRRIAAYRGRETTLRQFAKKHSAVLFETQWARPLTIAGLTVMAASVALAALPHSQLALDASQGAFESVLPWYPLFVLSGYWMMLPVSLRAGYLHAVDDEAAASLDAAWGTTLAAILSVSVSDWDLAGGAISIGPDGVLTATNLPIAARTRFTGIESRCELIAPSFTVRECSWSTLVLAPIGSEPEILATRAARAESGGLISGFENLPNTKTRPNGILWTIAGTAKMNGGEIDALAMATTSAGIKDQSRMNRGSMRLVELREANRTATIALLSPEVQQVRDQLARIGGVRPWEIEFTINEGLRRAGERTVESVTIVRSPVASRDSAKRKEYWLEQIPLLFPTPTGHMWRYSEDSMAGTSTLTCLKDPLEKILPYSADPSTEISPYVPWKIGTDEDGSVVEINLANSSHMLIAGSTRSGKSVCTYSLLTHALRMGEAVRLLVADPNDTTIAPFEPLVSWSTSSTHPAPVTEMFEWVRAEMDRRKPILRDQRQDKVSEFSPEMPMIVVVIDEAANYLKHADKAAAAELAGEMQAVAAQGAKYGVRLVLITQRPSADILPPAVRSQLSARISFRMEDKEGAIMAFPDIEDPSELLSFKTGVGIFREVGGKLRRFRAEYLADHWGAADQISRALPRVEIGGPVNAPVRPPSTRSASSKTPEVFDAGEFVFALEDLDVEPTQVETPVPTPLTPADSFAEPVRRPPAAEFTFSFDD